MVIYKDKSSSFRIISSPIGRENNCNPDNSNMQEKQDKILTEMLKLVPFDGWSAATLRAATQNSGLPEHYEQVAFKNGHLDAIELFHTKIDTQTYAALDKNALTGMKIRDRIYHILDIRFKIMQEYKPVIRKTLQFLSQPQNISTGTKMLWNMADSAWYAAGDTATDFNHYTKRTTLMAVYSSTLLFWLEDNSKQHQDTSFFLKRRINNVMQFEKFKGKVKEFLTKLSSKRQIP